MNDLPPVKLGHLLVGRAVPFGADGEPSAIDKRRVGQPLRLTFTGFDGDEQGDPRHHGGPDKAVHHYPAEHYAAWRRDCPELEPELLRAGGFGENLSTFGLTEENVCVGDVFRIGTALLQVSQARQPCWKLNLRFSHLRMSSLVQASGRTGWYYRVAEAGEVAPGDTLYLLERLHPDWPLVRLLHHLYADPLNREALTAMAALAVLPSSWRELARQRLGSSRVEDWSRRLGTPKAAIREGEPR
jgi:MOSC domain-containing protein YiiM